MMPRPLAIHPNTPLQLKEKVNKEPASSSCFPSGFLSKMSKFADFEGIDLESKEIYETSDVEDDFDLNEESLERRDSLIVESNDVVSSRQRFLTEMIDSQVTDFSDRIDKLQGYETYSMKETISDRLKRLRQELLELEEDIERDGDVGEEEEMKKLIELFGTLNARTKAKALKHDLPIKSESIDSYNTVTPVIQYDTDSFKDLELKISRLEKTIGLIEFTNGSSIQSSINELYRKFKILANDEDSLNSINVLIDEINEKIEKSIGFRRSSNLIEVNDLVKTDAKIHEIYSKFQANKKFLDSLPFIIKRLNSLNDLHLRAASSIRTVDDLDSQISDMKSDFTSWENSLTLLENKLKVMEENFNSNKESILKSIER